MLLSTAHQSHNPCGFYIINLPEKSARYIKRVALDIIKTSSAVKADCLRVMSRYRFGFWPRFMYIALVESNSSLGLGIAADLILVGSLYYQLNSNSSLGLGLGLGIVNPNPTLSLQKVIMAGNEGKKRLNLRRN